MYEIIEASIIHYDRNVKKNKIKILVYLLIGVSLKHIFPFSQKTLNGCLYVRAPLCATSVLWGFCVDSQRHVSERVVSPTPLSLTHAMTEPHIQALIHAHSLIVHPPPPPSQSCPLFTATPVTAEVVVWAFGPHQTSPKLLPLPLLPPLPQQPPPPQQLLPQSRRNRTRI